MRAAVSSNVPHTVGKSSALMVEFTEWILDEGSRGKDKSCTIRNLLEWGLGTKPRGDVRNGPINCSRSAGLNPVEYLPAVCSESIYASITEGLSREEE